MSTKGLWAAVVACIAAFACERNVSSRPRRATSLRTSRKIVLNTLITRTDSSGLAKPPAA